jgi:hypothetical protein
MGLLDDAIREHLELKRRRGADSEEVTRQEAEALGAPQRAEFAETEAPAEAPAADEPEPAPEEPAADAPREAWLDDEPEPAPQAAPEPDIPLDQPTVEYSPEPADEPRAEGEEDVLEETPDFLQETPEHDRLWFEQKPPRDFDLDR